MYLKFLLIFVCKMLFYFRATRSLVIFLEYFVVASFVVGSFSL